MSNYCAESEEIALKVIQSDIFEQALRAIKQMTHVDVAKEAVWMVGNIINVLTQDNIVELCMRRDETTEILTSALSSVSSPTELKVLLCSLDKMLSTRHAFDLHTERFNPVFIFQDANGIEHCVSLQSNVNHHIYEAAKKLLETHFPENGDELNAEMS